MKASTWKVSLGMQLVLLILTLTSLGLSARVNEFQEWFFAADILTFAVSLLSFILLLLLSIPICLSALNHSHGSLAYFITSRLHVYRRMSLPTSRVLQLGAYTLLSIFWLAIAAYGTSRWRGVPMDCPSLGDADELDEETVQWCRDLKGLRVMVWVLWVGFFGAALTTFRSSVSRDNRLTNGSEFLQWRDYQNEGMGVGVEPQASREKI